MESMGTEHRAEQQRSVMSYQIAIDLCWRAVGLMRSSVLSSRPEVPRSKTRHKNESPIDFVHSSRSRPRPRQGQVEIKTGLDPNTGVLVRHVCG